MVPNALYESAEEKSSCISVTTRYFVCCARVIHCPLISSRPYVVVLRPGSDPIRPQPPPAGRLDPHSRSILFRPASYNSDPPYVL